MNGVRQFALTLSGLLVGAALSGCAAQSGRTSVTAPGVFVSIDAGAAQIDADDLSNELEVDEDVSPSIQLGLGYQVNNNVAVEVRAGDFGTVEFTDGRELSYQLADVSGLLMWRQRNTSIFGRFGAGTFNNGGDFDVELETPVHAVIGGGVAYHALPNLDLRLSVAAHGSDAIVGSAGLVWRFGASSSVAPRIGTIPGSDNAADDDGFEAIAPVAREEVATAQDVTRTAPNEGTSNGLVIDEKPLPQLQNVPEPVISRDVTAVVPEEPVPAPEREQVQITEPAPAPTPVPAPAAVPQQELITEPVPVPVPVPEVDAVNIAEEPAEKLFVVDTLLDVRPLQFDQGTSTLLDASVLDLTEVSVILKANPELRLQVESHAAPVGNAELNMLLSRRRALTVIRLLVSQGIDAVRLRPRAFGDTAPLADANFIDDNDRVEFRIR